jgi:hypothetical protein
MTTMIPDLVVGSVSFAPSPGADADAVALRAENRELLRSNLRLVRVLRRCVKPSTAIANEASEAIEEALETRR